MANEVSLSKIKEKLVNVANAIEARNWDEAHNQLAVATALFVGLPKQVGFENSYARYENQIKELREQLIEAENRANRANNRGRRIIKTRTGYSR